MRDIKGFCKLMDLSVPDYTHFDYYINQFSKLNKWKDIKIHLKLYEDAEKNISNLFEFRIDKSNQIIKFLLNTRAFNELNDDNLLPDLPTTKNFEYSESLKYLSIDIKKANWVVLKKYDPDFLNELGNSYEEFLQKFDIPEIFYYSKQFRQYIFGNINPKRQCKAQRKIIQDLIDSYSFLKLKIACIKNDEIIYEFDDISQISSVVDTIDSRIFSHKIFEVKRVEDFRVNTIIDTKGGVLYKEMVGCDGNRYFLNIKKYILNEPPDIRDLYFRINDKLAIWSIEGLTVSL